MLTLKRKDISYLIHELRRRTGLTQQGLAAKIGVSFTSINRWENQKQQPTPLAIRRIKEVLKEMGDRGADLLEQYFAKE